MKKLITVIIALFTVSFLYSQTFLAEDFGSGTFPPTGWTAFPIGDNWTESPTENAGGSAPEARFEGFNNSNTTVRLITPAINVTVGDTLILIFKHYYEDNSGVGPAIGVAIQQGAPWESLFEVTPSGNTGPEEITVLIPITYYSVEL